MECKTTDLHDPEFRESFSFSSFDFDSSVGFFSDEDDNDEHNDEANFIEIALKPTLPSVNSTVDYLKHENRRDDETQKLELRISFSSSVPFPGFSSSSNSSIAASSSDEIVASASANALPPAPAAASEISCVPRTDGRRVRFPEIDRPVQAFQSSLKRSSINLIANQDGRSHHNSQLPPTISSADPELVLSRNSRNVTTAASSGGVMKLLIKFKSISIRSFLATLVRTRQVISINLRGNNSRQQISKRSSELNCLQSYHKLLKPSDHKWMTKRSNHQMGKYNDKNNSGNPQKSRGGLEMMNFDAVRGIFDAVGTTSGRKIEKHTKSCPGSIKSSPIHQGIVPLPSKVCLNQRENSVQAAIAHCKKSLGHAEEFNF